MEFMDVLINNQAQLGPTVDWIEDNLYTFANATGLHWGITAPEIYWFRRPIVHLVEFFLFNLMCYVTHLLCKSHWADMTTGRIIAPGRLKDSRLNRFLGVIFLLCFMSQILFKGLRPNPVVHMMWVLMPCHLITLTWAYICLCTKETSKSRGQCIILATLCASCHWGPVSAAALPDTTDHTLPPWEGYTFYLHHALLVMMPFYWATRYEFTPLYSKWMLHVFKWATFINVGPYCVVSFVAGINLNYMLAPPAVVLIKLPRIYDTVMYKVYTIIGLVILSIICRCVIGFVGWFLKNVGRVVLGISSSEKEKAEEEKGGLGVKAPKIKSNGAGPLASNGVAQKKNGRSSTPPRAKKSKLE